MCQNNIKKTVSDDRYESDIPSEAEEKTVSGYKRRDQCIWPKKTECLYKGETVGERFYVENDILIAETPLKNGKKHGTEYHWDENGCLFSAEPYENGLPHGTAFQWDNTGILIGTYTLVHGTGYDIWHRIKKTVMC